MNGHSRDLQEQLSPAQQIEREELEAAFRGVLSSASGKRVLFWMLEQCAIYQDAFSGENNATNYTLGLQAGGRKLIAKLDQIDPRLYPELLMAMAEIRAMDRAAADRRSEQGRNDDDVEA